MSRRTLQVTKEVHAQIKAIATSKGMNMNEAIDFLIKEYKNKNGEQSMYKQEEFYGGHIVRVKDNGYISLEDISNEKGKTYEDWGKSEVGKDFVEYTKSMVDSDLFADKAVALGFATWLDPFLAIEVMGVFMESNENEK